MLLTVAIPCYNSAPYVQSALKSCALLKLPSEDFEILVVDNGSTDDTIEKVRQCRPGFPNLRIIANDGNIGRLPNWIKCFHEARGTYLHYLFVTDLFHPENNIHHQVDILNRHQDISLCLSSFVAEYSEGCPVHSKRLYPGNRTLPSLDFLKTFIESGTLPFGPLQSNLFRVADIVGANIMFDESCGYRADTIFCAEAAAKRPNLYFTTAHSITWRIFLNPNRFHSNLRIEEMVRDDLSAFTSIDRTIFQGNLNFFDICVAELRSIVNHMLFHRRLLSPRSSYSKALTALWSFMRTRELCSLSVVLHFFLSSLARLFRFYHRKMKLTV